MQASEATLQFLKYLLQGAGELKYAGPGWTEKHGVSGAPVTNADWSTAPISITDAPSTGEKVALIGIIISNRSVVDMDFSLMEETSGTVVNGPWTVPAKSTLPLVMYGVLSKLATAGKKLQAQSDAAGNATIETFWRSEA